LACRSLLFPQVVADKDQAHWSYQGDDGPSHWAEISEMYRMCTMGNNQSPVELVAAVNAELPLLEFNYHTTPQRENHPGLNPGTNLHISPRRTTY
jgi:carbonic anhydrase